MLLLPSRRLFQGVAIFILASVFSPLLGWAGVLAMVLLFGLDALRAKRRAAPRITPDFNPRLSLGQRSHWTLLLEQRSQERMQLLLAADIPSSLAGPAADDSRALQIAPRGGTRVRFNLHARQRGKFQINKLHLRILGPLGLCWRELQVQVESELRVYPGLRESKRQRLLAWNRHLRNPGPRRVNQRGDSGSFESLREYVRGDDPRRIDWKSTARQNHMMVRRYEAERSQNIILCIDCGRQMTERIGGDERLDRALASALVLTDVARNFKDNLGLFIFSDRIQTMLPPARHSPERIARLLSDAQSSSVEPDYPRALLTLSHMVNRRSLMIFFSDVIDSEVSAPIAAHLKQLSRRHLPLFVALQNPELVSAASAPVKDDADAYHRAAAAELMQARNKTLQSMRSSGIAVLDVDPGIAIESVVNEYIDIKRRGSL